MHSTRVRTRALLLLLLTDEDRKASVIVPRSASLPPRGCSYWRHPSVDTDQRFLDPHPCVVETA